MTANKQGEKFKQENYFTVIEGDYTYYNNNRPYSEEKFYVLEHINRESTQIISEMTSRLPNGELLKINCLYEVTPKWLPSKVIIKKSAGTKSVQEVFQADLLKNTILYEFHSNNDTNSIRKAINGTYQISTPSFATALICNQHRNINTLGRTRYVLIVSENDWVPTAGISEKTVYMELPVLDKTTVTIHGKTVEAKKVLMYQHDSLENKAEIPSVFYMSKHFSIPYLAELPGNIKVQINHMKKVDQEDI